MANRATLKGYFNAGDRPTEAEFADLIDSVVNLSDTNGTIPAQGGIVLGNTSVPDVAGAIKWDGTNFLIRTQAGFQVLNTGGGALTNPQDIGSVRIGSTLTGGIAVFGHSSRYTNTDFGFGQMSTGELFVNGADKEISFMNRIQVPPAVAPSNKTVVKIKGGSLEVGTANFTPATGQSLLVIGKTKLNGDVEIVGNLSVTGDATKTNTAANWTVVSDKRTKKDISDFSEGLASLLQLNPIRFKYNGNANTPDGLEQIGVLAQEVQHVFPYMVSEMKTKLYSDDAEKSAVLTFNSSALQFVLVNAIKELNEKLNHLENYIKDQLH